MALSFCGCHLPVGGLLPGPPRPSPLQPPGLVVRVVAHLCGGAAGHRTSDPASLDPLPLCRCLRSSQGHSWWQEGKPRLGRPQAV